MSVYGIILDLDGVIVSTDKYHFLAWKHISEKNNLKFDKHICDKLRGVSREKSLEIILDYSKLVINNNKRNILLREKNEIYKRYLENIHSNDLNEGFYQFINIVKKENIKVAVASSSKNANFILKKLELIGCFDAVLDGNSPTKLKPDPEIFIKCSEIIGTLPEKCMVIEDSEAGIDAALGANMKAIYMGESQDILKKANLGIKTFNDLIPIEKTFDEVFSNEKD
jgi:beta-phosphoglucomutase